MENSGNALVDFGRFVTGFLVVMGVGMSLRLFTLAGIVMLPGTTLSVVYDG